MKIYKPGEYVMRGGNRCTIKIVDWPVGRPILGYIHGAEECPRQWNDDGTMSALHEKSEFDIVGVYRPMIEREGWVNVYMHDYSPRRTTGSVFESEDAAVAARSRLRDRGELISIGHITWKEPAE